MAVYDHTDTSVGANGTMYLYLDGALQGSNEIHPDVDLRSLIDNNNWLGRSQWNDPVFDGSFNEFRIYDVALNDIDVQVTSILGPDTIVPEPTTSTVFFAVVGGLITLLRRRRE